MKPPGSFGNNQSTGRVSHKAVRVTLQPGCCRRELRLGLCVRTRLQAMAEAAGSSVAGCRAGCHQGAGELKDTCVTVRHRSQPEGGALSYRGH